LLTLALGLAGVVWAEDGSASVPRGSSGWNRHPGQNGPLTPEQQEIAAAAWKYFENNYQSSTCLFNSVDGYPSTTMWDTASAIAGLVSAFELGLVPAPEFDRKTSCLLGSLQRIRLFHDELPNKAYQTITLDPVDYNNQPGETGFSAIDIGRLLTWLAIVKERYPNHAEEVDRVVLRWDFCNLIDSAGTLYGGLPVSGGGAHYVQEGRLGYEEYAANGFRLWRFDTTAAASLEPASRIEIEGVPIEYDARDPKQYGAHNYVVTESYLLSGLEMNWDLPGDIDPSDRWTSDKAARALAERVYKVQYRRWRRTGVLTARTEHQLDRPPYFIYDTVFSDGVPWATISDTGQSYPELAAVSTRAALGMWILFDTSYTRRLEQAVVPLVDPDKGLYEGFYESDGQKIGALTSNTNGIVLETLLYKVEGKLLPPSNGLDTLWDRVPNDEFPGNSQCLPRPHTVAEHAPADRGGQYQEASGVARGTPKTRHQPPSPDSIQEPAPKDER